MSELAIAFDDERRNFEPRDTVRGRALWLLDAPPRRIEVRLFWYTSGKGDRDVAVVEAVGFDDPGAVGEQPFELRIPDRPWSFSGKLISLEWSLEIVALPSEDSAAFPIVVGPGGAETTLPVDAPVAS